MDRRVLWAIADMDARLDRVEVKGLAAAVNLSASRFAHLFSRDAGMSPSRYLHALRMERARLLLERTFLSVKEVMARVGVSDASHFSRDFRRYHGLAPSEVRRSSRGTGSSPFCAAHADFLELAGIRFAQPASSANKQ